MRDLRRGKQPCRSRSRKCRRGCSREKRFGWIFDTGNSRSLPHDRREAFWDGHTGRMLVSRCLNVPCVGRERFRRSCLLTANVVEELLFVSCYDANSCMCEKCRREIFGTVAFLPSEEEGSAPGRNDAPAKEPLGSGRAAGFFRIFKNRPPHGFVSRNLT